VKRLVDRIFQGDVKAAARLITIIEDGLPVGEEAMKALYPHTGCGYIVGVTGPAGVGKSSLINRLIGALSKQNRKIGVIAIDPTSPLTGGAFLGDRIRMEEGKSCDVFIRSVARRGFFGDLSRTTHETINIMDALGRDLILVETMGIGQDQVDIASFVYTLVVVLGPGQGDEIQAMKAGIIEIGDIFVINKADIDGADIAVMDLQSALDIGHTIHKSDLWKPPIYKTDALHGIGVCELVKGIIMHKEFLLNRGLLEKAKERKIKSEITNIVKSHIIDSVTQKLDVLGGLDAMAHTMVEQNLDPYTVAKSLLEEG
jgi:LAO/AO transport system kinase